MTSNQALPSTPAIWNLATWRAWSGSHHSSSIGQGPAQASTCISSASSPMQTKAGGAVTNPRPVTFTGLRSSLSTADGIGMEKTLAGAGGGIEPDHGSLG